MRRVLETTFALALALAAASGSWAQTARGNIYGTVIDESGGVLPGAGVSLSGAFGSRQAVSDALGEFRFLNVDHGTHRLTVTLSGFAGISRDVIVTAGRNVSLELGLKVAAVEEVVTVSAETPIVDVKKLGTGTSITREELAQIPTSRDPWALMRTVPGILVDRVNVGGSESGQQSSFSAKGADPKDSVWTLDGVVITDQASMSSPSYYNYDVFDQVNFSTGGSDITQSAGGVGINLVTKRGTNQFHSNAGGFFTHDDLQWSNLPDELRSDPRLGGSDKADHTEQISDYSLDLGGPILKDKLWFFGSYGRNDIRIKNLVQNRDKTLLRTLTGKVNWQASDSDMVSGFWFWSQKAKIGRRTTFLQEAASHTWDQGDARQGGPPGLSKLEWNRVWSSSLFTNLKLAYYNAGFELAPQGGSAQREVIDNLNAEARGSSRGFRFLRPQYTSNLDLSWFTPGLGGSHEVKFGVGFRRTGSELQVLSPGDQVQVRFEASGPDRARFYRDSVVSSAGDQLQLYLSDSFTRGRLTLNAGVRLDRQTSRNNASANRANPAIPELMPELSYAGSGGDLYVWTNLNPRLGLTWALDESRRSVLRASYSRYAGLPQFATDANLVNPVSDSVLTFPWNDLNGDADVQLGEVDFSCRTPACGFDSVNIDPNDPTASSDSPNRFADDYRANIDDELVIGIDRELVPDLAISAAYTWRRSTRLTATQLWSGSYWYNWMDQNGNPYGPGDYVAQPAATAQGFSATSYLPSAAASDRFAGGWLLSNRDDLSRGFSGLELSLVKRLSNRWMGRVAFSYNDWHESVGPGAINNPTRHDWDPLDDGGQVATRETGSGKIYYMNARWQLNANALVQLGRGFEVAGNVYGRQGYPNPVYLTLSSGFDGNLRVLPDGFRIDQQRFASLWNVDLRLAKVVRFGAASLTLSAEAFNLLNSNAELKRLNQANAASFGRLDEILAPRIVRLGARLSF